ncbi:MAG: winged helix-turn-helix transcriptional regulator [Candidatus Bathyarchaeia archaeon]|nr:winged helix-turn-helix transcriptional regulator [Candidatus Bathyarchaeia archaeon]
MDEIDRKIISQLQQNGRTTLQDLSKIIGYTSMGTKKRLEKLLKNTIKVTALINPDALKLHPAIVMLEMESAEAMQDLIERFKDCPRVVHIFKTIGGYNLIALVVAENQETLESISTEKCSLRCSRGIRRSEFYPISDTYFSSFLQIRENLAHKEKAVTPCSVNCVPCNRYENQKCVGCPTTSHYKGTL